MSKDFSPQCGQTAVVLKLGGGRKDAFFPPLGGASIAPGYTPDAFAGAKPRHPLPIKGIGGRNAERGMDNDTAD